MSLAKVLLDVVLESPRLIILGDVNIHAKTPLLYMAQDFITSLTSFDLAEIVTGPIHERGHNLLH